jgi:type II secretory pathway pseudopilin PulG
MSFAVCRRLNLQAKPRPQHGFAYLEILVALLILAVAIVPAMRAIQSGVQGAGIHAALARQQFALTKRMEEVQAKSFGELLAAAKTAGNATTASSYSDPTGQTERVLVYLALYDADADPFTLTDPNTDGDSDLYTGSTANLLWLKVQLEKTNLRLETLVSR